MSPTPAAGTLPVEPLAVYPRLRLLERLLERLVDRREELPLALRLVRVERPVLLRVDLRAVPPARGRDALFRRDDCEPLRVRSAAVLRLTSLLKLLRWPLAVLSWYTSARSLSSNAWNHSSHEISWSDCSPE